MALAKYLLVAWLLALLSVICLRYSENKIVFEILDICRLFLNHIFELLKIIGLRIESIEIEEGHITVKFSEDKVITMRLKVSLIDICGYTLRICSHMIPWSCDLMWAC